MGIGTMGAISMQSQQQQQQHNNTQVEETMRDITVLNWLTQKKRTVCTEVHTIQS